MLRQKNQQKMNEEIMVFQVIYNEEFKDFQVKTMPTSKANNKYAKMFMGKFHPIYPRFNTIPIAFRGFLRT